MRRNLIDPVVRFAVEPEEPSGGGEEPQEPEEKLGEAGLKALQAEREARRQAEARVAEFERAQREAEDAAKTEEQRREERLAELERTARESELKALRFEVAAAKGIPLAAAARLAGSSREELEADADELKWLLTPEPRSPKPDPSQGGGETEKSGSVSSGRDLFRERRKSN